MKRNVVVGAWLAIMILSASGCAEVIGLSDGEAVTPCETGKDKRCVDNAVQECVNGLWSVAETCVSQTCVDNPVACSGVCEPGKKKCEGKDAVECTGGEWPTKGQTCPFVCSNGACEGECVPEDKRCSGQTVDECGTDGFWAAIEDCNVQGKLCAAGKCIMRPPSCEFLASTCGPDGDESCCAVTEVPGGTYNRSNDTAFPATVSSFVLDRFEVTVGRFRKFVEAYPGSKPAANAGKHALIAGTGWDSAWNMNLAADKAALESNVKQCGMYTVWTDAAGANENLPMNCLSWYEAFAFCAWDGGRLPTEAEWNYAAAGGEEQREYPWSNSTTIDASYAVYECKGNGNPDCVVSDILKVGSKSPKGDGRWGQADLAGSMWEWNLDGYDSYGEGCNNCADLLNTSIRVTRGGNWGSASGLLSSGRFGSTPGGHNYYIGARCARSPL